MKLRIALLFCGTLLFGTAARAADFVVDRLDDPAPNGCTPGSCSLREAVLAANAVAGQDRILLPVATVRLSIPGDEEDAGATGDLDVVDALEFAGQGSAGSIVEQDADDRVLDIADANFVRLRGVTISGGNETEGQEGAGIRAAGTTVDLDDARLLGNTGPAVGGMSFRAEANTLAVPRLTIRNSRFEANVGVLGTGALSISAIGQNNGPYAVIEDSWFVDNAAGTASNYGSSAGITMSHFGNDDSAELVVRRVVMSGNLGRGPGGAIELNYNGGPGPLLVLEDSELCGNRTETRGGALYVGSRAIVRRTTFCNNSAPAGDPNFDGGGAIAVASTAGGTALTLERSTFAGNSSTLGSAIVVLRGRINARGTTITPPSFLPVGTQGTVLYHAGTAADSLVLYNNLWHGSCVYADAAAKPSLAINNLEAPNDSCRFTTATLGSGNQVSVATAALALGTLADNGGPTRTRLPGADSVAIDAGLDAQCLFPDQRGYTGGDGGCDAGAVERSATADGLGLFRDGFE